MNDHFSWLKFGDLVVVDDFLSLEVEHTQVLVFSHTIPVSYTHLTLPTIYSV